jgi:SAM-dependent methyltransferase
VVGVNADEWTRRGSSFGTAAAAYAEHRPDYPADAVLWCVAPTLRNLAAGDRTGRDRTGRDRTGRGLADAALADAGRAAPDQAEADLAGLSLAGLRVLDLGAGTGKLTALLTALGADVTAVEPDAAMLAELRRVLPEARALSGSAEAIPVADASVDAVLCGQAMHWFDMSRAVPEIARVLAPGGVLGAMWNADDDRVEWVAGLQEAIGGAGSPSLSRWRAVVEYFGGDQFGASLFGQVERAEFANSAPHTVDSFVALLATHSQVLIMEPAERERVLARARGYLAARPETADGGFELPMVTSVLRTVRR